MLLIICPEKCVIQGVKKIWISIWVIWHMQSETLYVMVYSYASISIYRSFILKNEACKSVHDNIIFEILIKQETQFLLNWVVFVKGKNRKNFSSIGMIFVTFYIVMIQRKSLQNWQTPECLLNFLLNIAFIITKI